MATLHCPYCGRFHEIEAFASCDCPCGADWTADEDPDGGPSGEWFAPDPRPDAAQIAAVEVVCEDWSGHDGSEESRLSAISDTAEVIRAEYADLVRQRDRLKAALDDIMAFGVEFDDDRLGYVTVQLDRSSIAEARAALAECK